MRRRIERVFTALKGRQGGELITDPMQPPPGRYAPFVEEYLARAARGKVLMRWPSRENALTTLLNAMATPGNEHHWSSTNAEKTN